MERDAGRRVPWHKGGHKGPDEAVLAYCSINGSRRSYFFLLLGKEVILDIEPFLWRLIIGHRPY